ncbi:hypothetical protein MTO96_042051 [Rhipicephalus appendiculatus]
MADVDFDKTCLLLLSSGLLVGLTTWHFRGGTEDNKKDVDAPPAGPVLAPPSGCQSSFGKLQTPRDVLQTYRHEGGYIYSKGTEQLRKEDAAAATIQRWARTEFKRWLRDRALSRSSIDTSPLNSQRSIDQDHGAVVSTILNDPCVDIYTPGLPESALCSDNKVALEKCLLEIARRGGDNVDSSRNIRHRQKFSLSSKNISKDLLRLEPRADPRADQSPLPKHP